MARLNNLSIKYCCDNEYNMYQLFIIDISLHNPHLPFCAFYHVPFSWKGCGQHAAIRLQVDVEVIMPKIRSCDWSTWFIKVILLGLSLLRTSWQYRHTETGLQKYTYISETDPTIVCVPQVCVWSVKMHSSLHQCTAIQYICTCIYINKV